jgi:twitching motility two-component system response regulator PilH
VLKKVLVVDDSMAAVRMIQGILEKGGYLAVGLSDPLKLEETILAERPAVILLDVVMPTRNGFQICRELKGNTSYSTIPVILVSSRTSTSDKFWGQQQGADAYVSKPFTPEELLDVVRKFA